MAVKKKVAKKKVVPPKGRPTKQDKVNIIDTRVYKCDKCDYKGTIDDLKGHTCNDGRPTKYKEEYVQGIIDYFNVEHTRILGDTIVGNPLPQFHKYANKIGVCVDTMLEWCKKHPKFSESYKYCKKLQSDMLCENALNGVYQPTFAIFTAKNVCGWRDKQEHELTGKDGEAIKTANINANITGDNPQQLAMSYQQLIRDTTKED